MNLKQVTLTNNGMQQDLSISKGNNEFAYKNVNIRIQATGDGTLASITNIKSPEEVGDAKMVGRVLNSILCGEYLVVFTHSGTAAYPDHIYRIDLEKKDTTTGKFKVNTLYEGDLNFSYDKPIDSTFYYENDNVQKVYWVDGWTSTGSNNYPRVINIITKGERDGSGFDKYDANTNFDFYPEIDSIPTITAVKNFTVPSELPAGVIQYFVSYFNYNFSETLIAAGTSLYSIDLKTTGAPADKKGCAFNITIGNVSDKYEYIRLYSVRRTSINGDATVNIVKEFKIQSGVTSYSVLDNGVGQVTIDPGQIFFVGGTPLFAKTLTQKDNTLFVGGIKTEGVIIEESIKKAIENAIVDKTGTGGIKEATILTENRKSIPTSSISFNAFYPYKLQKDNESIVTKTFKVGEIYRFGIQFQNKQGQWSEVVWIGDKKIQNVPQYDLTNNEFSVSNIRFYTDSSIVTPEEETAFSAYKNIFNSLYQHGFVNYRLLMADPEYSNGRSILAQGIVCPTMFMPASRTTNSPHTLSSWIMRPRGGSAPYHHLEPLHPASKVGSELSTYDPVNEMDGFKYHNMPFEFINQNSDTYIKTGSDNNFYVDESIIGMYSPDINNDTIISVEEPKFRIVGVAPLHTNYSYAEVGTEDIGIDLNYTPHIDSDILQFYKIADGNTSPISPLYSDYMYIAPTWYPNNPHILNVYGNEKSWYNIHMWQHSDSIIGFNINEDKVKYDSGDSHTLPKEPLIINSSLFYNHLFSKYSQYFATSVPYTVDFGIGIFKDIDIKLKNRDSYLYRGNFEYLHANEDTSIYYLREYDKEFDHKEGTRNKIVKALSNVTFNSTPHAVFYLGKNSKEQLEILPRFTNEPEYKGIFTGKYDVSDNKWKDISKLGQLEDADINISKFFNKSINSIGLKLGAAWIDDLAVYSTDMGVSSVYDNGYKTMCSIRIEGNGQLGFTSIIGNFFDTYYNTVLSDYDYEEDGRITAVFYVDTSSSPENLKKISWTKNAHGDANRVLSDLSETEMKSSYPVLCLAGSSASSFVNYTDVWKGNTSIIPSVPIDDSTTSQDGYPILSPYYYNNNVRKAKLSAITEIKSFYDYIYTQKKITSNAPTEPYLFIGELYSEIKYKSLYGGFDKEALSKLTWIPISKPAAFYSDYFTKIPLTEGDTYYQRYDCLKTYPKVAEGVNQVIDVTSFMVETHTNLDERTDTNRASFSPVTRPETFNTFNTVYNQKNNLFSYTTLNELLSNENSHQVSWSLTKNIIGIVDTWTNITSANAVNLKHPVTKLVNFNNNVTGITNHSVEIINFNSKKLVATDDNSFIELQNSSKVDGTVDFSADKGSRNQSVLVTEAGLYFIEDNENSLIRISYNGEIKNIGMGKMDSWFKQNIVPGTHTKNNTNVLYLAYDAKHKDVYICNNDKALVYNEYLDSFTSFVDYENLSSLFTNRGEVYAIAEDSTDEYNSLFDLYGGSDYGKGFYNKPLPYSVEYRVNPGPYTDKVFTNVEFKADLSVTQDNSTTSHVPPFDTIQAWNEYQDTGQKPLLYDRLKSLRDKFRTWGAIIPRNNNTRDRIRNPWIHLKLDKPNVNGQKLEFHNITVTYME